MCGISGFSGNFEYSMLQSMNAAIAHRGPDGADTYFSAEDSLGLAHRRLAIIDLSENGLQPMWDALQNIVIVFNGEIYNFREIKADLSKQGYQFNNNTDTEVLLNLYLRDGTDMLRHLNGIYAFAIYDKRDKTLFIARDNLGIKPLYYAKTSKGFIFSSEIKAILQEPSVSREVNPQAVHNHLIYLWSPAPDTMLRSVKKLKPGHALVVKDGNIVREWQFYDLPYTNAINHQLDVNTAADHLQQHLNTAVTRQMIADVPVGAFLSGGLDSSSIVAFARKINPDIQCFTIGFKGANTEGMAEDLPYAQKVAKHLGVKLHTVDVDPKMCLQLEKMLYHLDEPQPDLAALNAYLITQLAHEQGIKVLLSGAGGDDIFTGYRRHYALTLEKYWNWLPSSVKNFLAVSSQKLPKTTPFGRRFAKLFSGIHLPVEQRIANYFCWLPSAQVASLYSDEFHMCLQQDYHDPLLNALNILPENVSDLNRMLFLEGKYFLADHNLNYTDKMSMATGVEVRVPLLDKDLIDFATRLPLTMKQKGNTGKWLFKKAMEPYLPKEVIYRPKTGFGVPLRHWLKNELKDLVYSTLCEQTIRQRGFFNPQAVHHLLNLQQQGKIDATYTIFSLVCIELWCKIFLDNPVPTIN